MNEVDKARYKDLTDVEIPELFERVIDTLIKEGLREETIRKIFDRAVSEIKWNDTPDLLPRDGTLCRIGRHSETVVKWELYRPNSQQFKKGIKGRWTESNYYGGFYNAKFDPEGQDCTFLGVVE